MGYRIKSTQELRKRTQEAGKKVFERKQKRDAANLKKREKQIFNQIKFKKNVEPRIFVKSTLRSITNQVVLNEEIASLLRAYKKDLSEGRITGDLKLQRASNAAVLALEALNVSGALMNTANVVSEIKRGEVSPQAGFAASVVPVQLSAVASLEYLRKSDSKKVKVAKAARHLTPAQIEQIAQKIDAKSAELEQAHARLHQRYEKELEFKKRKKRLF